MRNSWNTDWGEDCGNGAGGCVYLSMGENTCGVANEAMTVSFDVDGDDDNDDKDDDDDDDDDNSKSYSYVLNSYNKLNSYVPR